MTLEPSDDIIVGTWVVYPSAVFDRWLVRQVVGETNQFWVVQPERRDGSIDMLETRRISKKTNDPRMFAKTRDHAMKVADALTDRMSGLTEKYENDRAQAIVELLVQPDEDMS